MGATALSSLLARSGGAGSLHYGQVYRDGKTGTLVILLQVGYSELLAFDIDPEEGLSTNRKDGVIRRAGSPPPADWTLVGSVTRLAVK